MNATQIFVFLFKIAPTYPTNAFIEKQNREGALCFPLNITKFFIKNIFPRQINHRFNMFLVNMTNNVSLYCPKVLQKWSSCTKEVKTLRLRHV